MISIIRAPLHKTGAVQHVDHLPNDLQFILRHVQPQVKGFDHRSTYFFARIGGDVCKRFKKRLF